VDLNQAIQFGLLVKAAETVLPANTAPAAGQTLPATYDSYNVGYKVVSTILGNDLATITNPGRGDRIVSFGFILQAPDNDAIIGIREWIHDFEFLATRCPFLPGADKTDDGFTAIYNSLRVTNASTRLVDARWQRFNSITGQLVDDLRTQPGRLASHTACRGYSSQYHLQESDDLPLRQPTHGGRVICTYVQPGSPEYLSYRQPRRYCSQATVVTSLRTRGGTLRAKFGQADPPTFLVKCELACEHHMTSDLHLLSLLVGKTVQPLDAACVP
jgi:hypothetical protein